MFDWKPQKNGHDERPVDAEMTRRAQQNHFGLSQQRTEIDHGSHADEDEQREEFGPDPRVIDDFHHPCFIGHPDIRENASKPDGQEEHWFVFLDYGQDDEDKTDSYHNRIPPGEGGYTRC